MRTLTNPTLHQANAPVAGSCVSILVSVCILVVGLFSTHSAFAHVSDSVQPNSTPNQVPAILSNGFCSGSKLTVAGINNTIHSIEWNKDGKLIATSPNNLSILTVAGGNGEGAAKNQFEYPLGICVDAAGNRYIADQYNHRVQKWAPGATSGITVAGGNGQGSGANQLNYPYGVAVDQAGNLYVSDASNHRIQKWAPGAVTGSTVAGGNGRGAAANQFSFPYGISIDTDGKLYVADYYNFRIQQWVPGATQGVTVAGGKGKGKESNQLNFPTAVAVDKAGNVFVADSNNDRIQKWTPGSVMGITVAGGNGRGNNADQFSFPTGVCVDSKGNLYITDISNHRIQCWTPGALKGITLAGGKEAGNAANQLNYPYGLGIDGGDHIYVTDQYNHRIQQIAGIGVTTERSFEAQLPGEYHAVLVYNNGSRINTASLRIQPTPAVAAIAGPDGLCTGNYAVFTDATPGGIWSSSNPQVVQVDENGVVNAMKAGLATLTYAVITEGCAWSMQKKIQVHAKPQLDPIVMETKEIQQSGTNNNSAKNLVCVGSSKIFETSNTGGFWSSSDSNIASIDQKGNLMAHAAGKITVVYSVDLNGCAASVNTSILVHAKPALPQISGINTITEQTGRYLKAQQTTGKWSSEQEGIATVNANGLVTGQTPGVTKINYQITDTTGCTATTTMVVTIQPVAPVVKDSVYLLTQPGQPLSVGAQVLQFKGAVNLYRTANGAAIEAGDMLVPGIAGDYTLWASQRVNGVVSLRVPFRVVVLAPTQSPNVTVASTLPENNTESLRITVGSNPATTYFTLKLQSRNQASIQIRVMDAFGRAIENKLQVASNSTIQLGQQYKAGTYFAEMIQGTERKVIQLIKIG